MALAKQLEHILTTKGMFHAMERSAQVLYRFARGRKHFDAMIDLFESQLPDVRVTFCTAASLLERHSDAFERLVKDGHEFAAHGFYHSRMDYLDREQQKSILLNSYQEFERTGFDINGFRCPYLNFNDDTLDALQASPYAWTSQEIVFWRNGHNRGIDRLRTLYHTRDASEGVSIPFCRGRILEIPITAPDDEMMVERMRIRDPREIARIWAETFQRIYGEGELCHLLFHPERVQEIAGGIREVHDLAKSSSQPVWIATVNEISHWWRDRAAFRWTCGRESDNSWVFTLTRPTRSMLLLRNPEAKLHFFRNYEEIDSQPSNTEKVRFKGTHKPTVWISNRCPQWVSTYLASEGFLVEQSETPDNQAVRIEKTDVPESRNRRDLLDVVEASTRPVYRLWRWPDSARSALTISADIDAITLYDFWRRMVNF